jgi:ABC-type microcin C transport system permease subunit YejB
MAIIGIGHNQPAFVSINSLSAEDKKKIKGVIMELNDSMTRMAAERDLQKEAVNNINDALGVDKKLIKRMAKAYYKANYNEEVEENNTFEEFYDTIVSGKDSNG